MESTRIGRLSHATEDPFDMSTTVEDRSTMESEDDQPAPSNQIQNQSTSSTHATSTVNGSVGPALDASFDLTVHGEAEEEEIVEQ